MSEISPEPVEVVAGVIRDAGYSNRSDGPDRILVSKRPPGRHLANCWEFPGGKLEPGESHAEALRRELHEEIGIDTRASEPLVSVTHRYPEKIIRLWLYEVSDYAHSPHGREGQALQWVSTDVLPELEMPAADRPLVKVLPLDGRYAISLDPAQYSEKDQFLRRWQGCLDAGFRLLRLRTQGDGLNRIRNWLPELAAMTQEYGARWLVSGSLQACLNAPADGVHLNSHQLAALSERPVDDKKLLAASCDDLSEIEQADTVGADFVLLSPVHATPSHPEAQGMGWDRLSEFIARSPLPVFALGGMRPEHLQHARALGAFGVAGISNFGWQR